MYLQYLTLKGSISAYLPYAFHRNVEIFLYIQGLWWKDCGGPAKSARATAALQRYSFSPQSSEDDHCLLIALFLGSAAPYKSSHCSARAQGLLMEP